MEICRSCLLTEQDMIALDEFCVESYNLLTNLQIAIKDEMPQYLCQNCYNMIRVFIDFREKAILSESTLRDITENTKLDISFENKHFDDGDIKTENDDYNGDITDSDNDVINKEEVKTDSCNEEINSHNSQKQEKGTLFQCGMCTTELADNKALVQHINVHKRGGTCKLCFEKVKIVDLYDHIIHAHRLIKNDVAKIEQMVKQEVPIEDFFDNCGVSYHEGDDSVYQDDIKKEKKIKKIIVKIRKSKRAKIKTIKEKIKKTKKNKTKAQRNNILHCGLCKIMFDSKELLVTHLEGHRVKEVSICKICNEMFSSWPQMFGHRVVHLPSDQRHCHLCNRRCSSQVTMEFHYKKFHYDGEEKGLRCKQCYKLYGNPKKVISHIRSVHRKTEYTCDYCSKSLRSRYGLISHILAHMGKKPYNCDMCQSSFKIKQALKAHQIRMHDSRKIVCKVCRKIFVDPVKAEQHDCNATKTICPNCGKIFYDKKSMVRHQKSHLPSPAYKCPRCPAAFRAPTNLKIHLDRHDGTRNHRCQYCDAAFFSANVLIKHRRIHTGEKPYVCKICHKGFTGNNNLKVHMKIHGEYLIVKKDKTLQNTGLFT